MSIKCDNCSSTNLVNGYGIKPLLPDNFNLWWVCSLTCLTELAWKLRESQRKLSKSQTNDFQDNL